jgi:hypothetical protein
MMKNNDQLKQTNKGKERGIKYREGNRRNYYKTILNSPTESLLVLFNFSGF